MTSRNSRFNFSPLLNTYKILMMHTKVRDQYAHTTIFFVTGEQEDIA